MEFLVSTLPKETRRDYKKKKKKKWFSGVAPGTKKTYPDLIPTFVLFILFVFVSDVGMFHLKTVVLNQQVQKCN